MADQNFASNNINFLRFYESLKTLKNLHSLFSSQKSRVLSHFLENFFKKFLQNLELSFFEFFKIEDEFLRKKSIYNELKSILAFKDSFFLINFFSFYDNFFFFLRFLTQKKFPSSNPFINFFFFILPNNIDGLIKQTSLNFFNQTLANLTKEVTLLQRTISEISFDIEKYSGFNIEDEDSFYDFFYKNTLNKQDFSFLLTFFYKNNSLKSSSFFYNNFHDVLNVVLKLKNLKNSFFFNKNKNFFKMDLAFKEIPVNVVSIFNDKFLIYHKLFYLIFFIFDFFAFLKEKGLSLHVDNKFFFKIFFYNLFLFSFSIKIFEDNFSNLFLDFLDNLTLVLKKLFGYFLFFFQNFQRTEISNFADFFLSEYVFFEQLASNKKFFQNFQWF